MLPSPFHPHPHALCSYVKAVNADMGHLPNMHRIMNNFSKVPINIPLKFEEVRSLKQLPVVDLGCWNVQNLNKNETKQVDNIIDK